jgi:hypothetical protein
MADQAQTAASSPSAIALLTEALSLEPVQTLPGVFQSWIGKLESRAGSADKFSLSREEGQDLIRLLSTASEAIAESAPAHDLVHEEQDHQELKAKIRLGDYAAFLFKDLKLNGALGNELSKHADEISLALRAGDGTVRQALQTSVRSLSVQGGDMGFDTAAFAIHAYAARNAACHSEAGHRKIARDWDGLAHQIDEDLSALPDILSDGELQHQDKWTRIIHWFRDRSIEQDEDSGLWTEKPPEPPAGDLVRDPTLLDVRNLPLPIRPRAFHRGLFDGSPKPNGTTNAARRKIEAKSDPTPSNPRKRKADGISDSEGPRKLRCVVPESRKSNPGKWDEFDRLSLDMSNQSRELAERDVSRSVEVLKVYRDSIKIAMADLEEASSSKREAEEKRKRKAASKARRQAKVAGK